MLSKNFDSHGSCNRDSAHTEKSWIFFSISVYLSQTEILSNWFGNILSAPKSSTEPWCPVHFHLSSSTCLFKQVFPWNGALSSYTVSIYPSYWKTPVKDLCLLTKCTNTTLIPNPFLPLSSIPSFLRQNFKNTHQKISFKLVISFSTLFCIFPSILLEKKFMFSYSIFCTRRQNKLIACSSRRCLSFITVRVHQQLFLELKPQS